MDGVKVIRISRSNEKKHIDNGLKVKDKAIFIITDYMEVSLEELKINEVIVLFADNNKFNYKKLVYLCGNASNLESATTEVLFVSREISAEMENAKNMAREFNKRIWARKYMNS
jgi:late competence protein required for DNA uptake (superfamily II DNA/RNA helicase)